MSDIRKRRQRGFTLVEMVVVMVILGILAVVSIPTFINLTQNAQISATQANLGTVRSVLAMRYAQNALNGNAVFPAALATGDFANNAMPLNRLSGVAGVAVVAAAPAGTATDNANGFWYIEATGVAGAYSDGSVDTSAW